MSNTNRQIQIYTNDIKRKMFKIINISENNYYAQLNFNLSTQTNI